jgi:hypothetical protein
VKHNFISICLIMTLSLLMACNTEPEAIVVEDAVPTIKGIWTIEEMDVGTGENRRTTTPQAFMMFIGDKHYSAIRDFTPEPRETETDQDSAEEGFRASLGSFMADAGTYTYDGSTLVVHHEIGMMPIMMNRGSSMTFGCELEGPDTLILTPQYDKMVMPGMKIAPSAEGKMSYGDAAVLYRFKRLE